MENNYLIAVDIGTQGTKTALLTAQGTIRNTAFAPSIFYEGENGKIEQKPEDLYRSVTDTIRQVIAASQVPPGAVAAIGVDGMMAGIVGLDARGNAITPYDSGLDKRCEHVIRRMQKMGEDRVIALSGCPIIVAQGAKMYWWKEERPEAYEKVAKFVPAASYVCGRMAGLQAKDAYIDYTHIHLTCLADAEKNQWSRELLELYGFDGDKLPRIVKPWEIIGRMTKEAAALTGLQEGMPLVAGCGDTPASSFGAGMTKPGALLDIAGTAAALSACVKEFRPDVKNKALVFPRSVLEGLWTPFGFALGGQTMDWYRRQTGLSFRELDEEAEKADSENLFFLPFFAGRICPSDPTCSGSWLGMKFFHKRGEMHRSVMEAIAYEYKYYLECLKEIQPELSGKSVTTISGGSKSEVLTQIKADIMGIPFCSLKQKDTALLAAGVIAGYGVGIYSDLEKCMGSMVEENQRILPREERTMQYEKQYEKYRQIVKLAGQIYHTVEL